MEHTDPRNAQTDMHKPSTQQGTGRTQFKELALNRAQFLGLATSIAAAVGIKAALLRRVQLPVDRVQVLCP